MHRRVRAQAAPHGQSVKRKNQDSPTEVAADDHGHAAAAADMLHVPHGGQAIEITVRDGGFHRMTFCAFGSAQSRGDGAITTQLL
jgi:hypothetical protein